MPIPMQTKGLIIEKLATIKAKTLIRDIMIIGSNEDKRALYSFKPSDPIELILQKFDYFIIGNFSEYLKSDNAPFHKEMKINYIKAYIGEANHLNIGYRGSAKTSLKKLFDAFTILNDSTSYRKYYKVMTADIVNSKQIVVDVYNMILSLQPIYGTMFGGKGKGLEKKEETMKAFETLTGIRYSSGTVGTVQRGQLSGADRPDYIWFEDIENSDTIKSVVKTQTIVAKCDESIQGMDLLKGNYVVTANYITDTGVIEWFKSKKLTVQITPIIDENYLSTWQARFTQERILKLKRDAEDWAGDYLCNPEKAGDIYFEREFIDSQLNIIENPIKRVGLVDLWKEYNPKHSYGVGGDTSEGLGADANALTVFDFTTNTVIGTFFSNIIDPGLFGYEMVSIGEFFGGCLLVPEINNTGFATLEAIKESNYSKIYTQLNTDRRTAKTTEKLGWSTNSKTKTAMWNTFKKDFEDGYITILSKALLLEMRGFKKQDYFETGGGTITRHFDLLTSAVVGYAGKEQATVKRLRKRIRREVKNPTLGI